MKPEDNFHHYNKNLRPLAHALRYQMTKAEACLWKYVLSAGAMRGYTFRRQRPVLDFIVDFMSKDLMLVIEVDGLTHDDEAVLAKDAIKANALQEAGFTVMRFNDNKILQDIDNVSRAIEDWIIQYEEAHGMIPPPYPRQRGTRNGRQG